MRAVPLVLTDNTWATPLHRKVLEHGVDLSIQSGTKYLCGHSDTMLGTVSANADALPRLKDTVYRHGPVRRPRRHESRAARLAHARGAARAPPAVRSHHRALARAAAGGAAACCTPPCPAIPAMPSGSATTPARAACSRSCSSPCRRRRCSPSSTGCRCSAWARHGAASRASPFRSMSSGYRSATTWAPGGPALRFHIGLEDVGDLIADLERGFASLAAAL